MGLHPRRRRDHPRRALDQRPAGVVPPRGRLLEARRGGGAFSRRRLRTTRRRADGFQERLRAFRGERRRAGGAGRPVRSEGRVVGEEDRGQHRRSYPVERQVRRRDVPAGRRGRGKAAARISRTARPEAAAPLADRPVLIASTTARYLGGMGTLENRVVIVTGASRGIGAAGARAFAAAGAKVVLAARDEAALNEVITGAILPVDGGKLARSA